MRCSRSLCAMNALNASAVVAKPPGTDTPRPASWPIISPSEEFLPPTWARSVRRRSRSQRILALKSWAPEGFRYFSNANTPGVPRMPGIRPVFYVSDGTGFTAETIGHSLLTQFSGLRFTTDRLPFVDIPDKPRQAADTIRQAGEAHGLRPVVVNSC